MKIGLLATVDHHIDSFFLSIADHWISKGHEVEIATGDAQIDGERERIPHLGRRPTAKSFAAIKPLRDWQDTQDIVLTNTAVSSTLARLTRTSTPVVYFAHGLHWNDPPNVRSLPWRVIERSLLKRTSGVIVLNNPDEAWVQSRFNGPLLRLPFGVGLDTSRFQPRPPISDDTLRLAWIGEFSARKRPHDAVAVASRLRDIGVPFTLTMLGRGALHSEVTKSVDEAMLNDHVRLEGFGDANALLGESHALLHTATWEGLPRVILEAASVGRVTFGYSVKGVNRAPCTVTVADGDQASLADTIQIHWSNGALRRPLENAPTPSSLSDITAAEYILNFLGVCCE